MNCNNTQITESNWLEWLVKRISVRTMDANRLYASEILAILLQSSDGRLVAIRLIGTGLPHAAWDFVWNDYHGCFGISVRLPKYLRCRGDRAVSAMQRTGSG
jgi:hypothetical protein